MKTAKTATLVLAAILLSALACAPGGGEAVPYHCPMHPTYLADRAGSCPICGMDLVKVDASAPAPAEAAAKAYACPMNCEPPAGGPGICGKCGMDLVPAEGFVCPMLCEAVAEGPGRCGKCGMDLMPVRNGVLQSEGIRAAEGMAPVRLNGDGVALAGVRTAVAEAGALGRSIRAAGTVAADESRVRHVHAKLDGWVEKLHVGVTGQAIRQGQPLLELYSPELLASQEEYLNALRARERFEGSSLPEVGDGARDLLEAARRRLALFDVPEDFILGLEASGRASRTVTLHAPASGHVLGKAVVEGHRVEPGTELFTIADLSTVWVEAAVYESDAPSVRVGTAGEVRLPDDPGAAVAGRVVLVLPALEPETRTLRVRVQVPNPGLRFKPGMFAEVVLRAEAASGVLIPDSALLDTGTRRIVFVESGPGSFEPREVETGLRDGGRVLVRSGVAAGERVVVKANFLLDSESRLRAQIGTPRSEPPDGRTAGNPETDPHAGHRH
jgi:multidrug efflux pump subunit AcrA (membrane-fusion protein)